MKKRYLFVLILAVLCMFFVSCGGAKDGETEPARNEQEFFLNQNLEIVCEEGDAYIRGSFDNVGSDSEEYTVCFSVSNGDKNTERTKNFELLEGSNEFEIKVSVNEKEIEISAYVVAEDEMICEKSEKTIKSFRLLSVGNSFSVDAQQHLYGIAEDMGYNNIVLGNIYFGGCSVQSHLRNAEDNKAIYTYYKNTTGTWTETPETTMLYGLTDEKWDYITLQQSSGFSGESDSYQPYLDRLVNFIKLNRTNPKSLLLWHMTWAYSSDSTHQDFVKYDNDQMKMYEGIVGAVNDNVVNHHDIAFVLPAGTAIQNARNTELGDTLCRDGFHLELGYGRYLAGLTWIHKITGESIDDVTFIPDNMFDEATLEILKTCAKNAVANPFEVTK